MKSFSLVLTSYDRQFDLDRFAASIKRQTYSGMVQVIYVAQGTATLALESIPGRLAVETIHAGRRLSASAARNLAATRATGDIIAFPDDDCWYPDDLLEKVAGHFSAHADVSCICASIYDPIRKVPYGRRPFGVKRRITYANLFRLPIEAGVFFRREAFLAAGGAFPEELGPGTCIGSGEGTELIGRLLEKQYRIEYLGDLQVYHPVLPRGIPTLEGKHYAYAFGFGVLNGRYLRAGHLPVLWHLSEVVLRSCAGALLPGRGRPYRERLAGIRNGLLRSLFGKGEPRC